MLILLGLGLFEGVIHVAGIKIHKLKKPYTPGVITRLIMFAYSVFVITQINKAGGLSSWQWIVDFRKMAMARVLGNKK